MYTISKKIHPLSEDTINQIAAGEVIENPASVVKELVENAIDAHATHLYIETSGGGFQSILVRDDGVGIEPEDLPLAIQRHATSKIATAEDLFALMTMGFRGEALASIAAISKMQLSTATSHSPAMCLSVEGGKVLKIEPCARAQGTTVEISSLFFNVPARKKFQKSATSSAAEITKIVTQLALAHPQVGFELVQQGRPSLSLPPAKEGKLSELLFARASLLLGKEFTENASLLEGPLFTGWIASPAVSRPNRQGQYLFINQRPVLCPGLSFAVRDAYATRLSPDRHPLFLLHVALDPAEIDANVHPQKREVRLKEEGVLKFQLHSAVNAALCKERGAESGPVALTIPDWTFREERTCYERPLFFQGSDFFETPTLFEEPLHALGLFSHYLLVDASSIPLLKEKGGIALFDLPLAESTLWFEKIQGQEQSLSSQRLLLPLTLAFSKAEAAQLLGLLPLLKEIGIEMRAIAEEAFLIETLPDFLGEESLRDLLHGLIDESKTLRNTRDLSLCLLQKMPQRKKIYSFEEAQRIVKELLKLKNPFLCPRGKPTMVQWEEEEIAKRFKSYI